MAQYLITITQSILDLIFPKFCFNCNRIGMYLCVDCVEKIPRQLVQRCIICQKPSLDGLTHPKCQTKYSPDILSTTFDYKTFPIAKMIITGKYSFVPEIFTCLGELIKITLNIDSAWMVIPIPLSNKRKRWRGFNQSEVLANIVAATYKLQTTNVISRVKHTKTQKNLAKMERITNMQNAFMFDFLQDCPKNIILIDDITTTGSTFIEAGKILKKAGADKVWCLAIAQD